MLLVCPHSEFALFKWNIFTSITRVRTVNINVAGFRRQLFWCNFVYFSLPQLVKLIVDLNRYKMIIALAESCFTSLLRVTGSFFFRHAGWECFIITCIGSDWKLLFPRGFNQRSYSITWQYSENRDLPWAVVTGFLHLLPISTWQ